MDSKSLAKQARQVLLDESLSEALEVLEGNREGLSVEQLDELDSYHIRKRELEKNNRKGIYTPDHYSAQSSKLDADFMAFLRVLTNDVPSNKAVDTPILSSAEVDDIQNLITHARLDAAFNKLKAVKSRFPKDHQTRIMALVSQWETIQKEQRMGLLDHTTRTNRTNQITFQLLELVG